MNIQKVLKSLAIDKTNIGVSTGAKWIKTNAPVLTSYSPVDGKKIAIATTADEKTYHAVIDKQLLLLTIGVCGQRPNEARWCVKLVTNCASIKKP